MLDRNGKFDIQIKHKQNKLMHWNQSAILVTHKTH